MIRDASGTITLGGTAQTALAANPNRRHLLIQNLDAAEVLWVNFGVTAVALQPSLELSAQTATGAMNFLRYDAPSVVPDESISVLAATTNHKFVIKWS